MAKKPKECAGCPLAEKGSGYAPADGPTNSPLLFVGEALGRQEALAGRPFVGPAGEMLNRIFRRVGIERAEVRVDNVVRCQPPNDWLVGAPWEHGAVQHCSQYLNQTLSEPHQVIVALGASATRRLLGHPNRGWKQENWHGSPVLDPRGDTLVVPTFHPAFLLRGKQNLIGVVCYDIQVARSVAAGTWRSQPAELVVDPTPQWFAAWAEGFRTAARAAPETAWLAVDIETQQKLKGKDEAELDDIAGDDIVRVNFSHNPDVGITVPFYGQYIDTIRELLSGPGVKCFWNARYDVPRLRLAACPPAEPVLDFMWAWHVLQSDLPRGLGFVAPFYSRYGPWKHLSGSDPGKYAAIDAVQTLRIAFGVAKDLQAANQWEAFYRHVYLLDTTVLHPGEAVGLLVDKEKLSEFKKKLVTEKAKISSKVQALVPDGLRGEQVWKRQPGDSDAAPVVRTETTQLCRSCLAADVSKVHRCSDRTLVPRVEWGEAEVERWVKKLDFNPASPQQLLRYIESKGLKGGRAKKSKTDQASTDKKTLEALAKSTQDPFFKLVLDLRQVDKVLGTYVEGAEKRLGPDGRLHAQFTHAPSTLRLSCVNPNLQNVKTDSGAAKDSITAGFRSCLVAAAGCRLIEADFSGIEAVLTGWFSGDPDYIRLAKLGVHAYLASHDLRRQGKIREAADLKWSDADLGGFLRELKGNKAVRADYDRAKRCVHGTNYGLTPIGMVNNYPEIFDRRSAESLQRLYFELCPKLKSWQDAVRQKAGKQGYLGGEDHPFHYKHWFWSVFAYDARSQSWRLGDDSKRCVAYYPQSTAAGVLADSALGLFDPGNGNYVGDAYHGSTPLRALVHDSLLLEVPEELVEMVIEKVVSEMTEPVGVLPVPAGWNMGTHLSVGVSVKVGQDWFEMEEVALGQVGVASDTALRETEEEKELNS